MNELKLQLNGGVGDVILTRNLLDSIKQNYKHIFVTPNESIIRDYRKGNMLYLTFITEFMHMMFDIPPYVVIKDKGFNRFSVMDGLLQNISIPNNGLYYINEYSKQLCNKPIPMSKEYIVITTKVRGTPSYHNYKPRYKDTLINLLKEKSDKYDIILLGERTIPDMIEYRIIGKEHIYCIYNDLMEKLSDKCMDLTISAEESELPNLNRLKDDCSIMNGAKAVISLGFGGNLILSLATAKSSINFLGDDLIGSDNTNQYYTKMTQTPQRNGVIVTNKFNTFINKIKEI